MSATRSGINEARRLLSETDADSQAHELLLAALESLEAAKAYRVGGRAANATATMKARAEKLENEGRRNLAAARAILAGRTNYAAPVA